MAKVKRTRQAKVKTQIRREQIVQAAIDVVAEHGVLELSVALVAKRVGFVPSAIYRHFQRKDQILDAILQRIHQTLMYNVAMARGHTHSAVPQLLYLAERHVEMILNNQIILRIVFSEAVYGRRRAWRAKIRGMLDDYLGAIADLVRQGQESGQVQRPLNPSTIAVMFLGIIQPAAVLWHISDGEFNLRGHLKDAWPTFVRGISG